MNTKVETKITDKKYLYSLLNDLLISQTEKYKDDGKSISERGWLKTQLLEYYDKFPIQEFIKKISEYDKFKISISDDNQILVINETSDSLVNQYYMDISDKRFWTLFSTAKYDIFKKAVQSLEFFSLDRTWLPSQFLRAYVDDDYEFRGYSAKFDNEPLSNLKDFDSENLFKFNMQSSGQSSKLIFDVFTESPKLKSRLSVSGIKLKSILPNSDDYVIDDVVYSGKVTSIGNSLSAHNELLLDIQGKYKKLIEEQIEKKSRIDKDSEGFISGVPVEIFSEATDTNFIELSSRIFDGRVPFKLWGIKNYTKNDFIRIRAVDLHTDGLLTFEILKDKIYCYIPTSTCGNTIVRFFVVLQQHVDSSIQMKIDDKLLISDNTLNA